MPNAHYFEEWIREGGGLVVLRPPFRFGLKQKLRGNPNKAVIA